MSKNRDRLRHRLPETVKIATPDGWVEVTGHIVPGTDGCLAVRPDESDDGRRWWILMHVPTGWAIFWFLRRRFAKRVAQRLWDQVDRDIWRSTNIDAMCKNSQQITVWLRAMARCEAEIEERKHHDNGKGCHKYAL